jgi:glycosyltransferase involved in cell wall biosynthesis
MTRPDISLIVNTFQKPRHLALVLGSIALQEGIDGRFEVVVADDGSDATTVEIISDFARRAPFPVAFTTEPHDGFRLARVRNRGAALAAGDTLLFLDGDSVLPPDHVAIHLAARRPGWAMLGDVVRLPEAASRDLAPSDLATTDLRQLAPATELRRMSRRHRKSMFQNFFRHRSKPRLAGGNFAVWRDDYSRVNGSDERFLGWGQEDDDLGLRLRGAGVRLASILDRTFTYHVWHPSDPSATPRWRDGVNVRYFLRRGRLSRCRRGLRVRDRNAVCWGLPDGVLGSTSEAVRATPPEKSLSELVAELLADAPVADRGAPCEIDVCLWPGEGRFRRRAECRLLLIEEGSAGRCPTTLRRRADRIAIVAANDEQALLTLLEEIG